jgi:mono/diheme cytochrome c family protein
MRILSFKARRRLVLSWFMALLFSTMLLGTAELRGAPAPSDGSSSPAVKQGNDIFHKRCISCHNKQPGDTSPFGPPNLYEVFHQQPSLTSKQAETIIVQGKGLMPAFGGILSKSDIRSVIAYLRTKPL